MNQEKATATGRIKLLWERGLTSSAWHPLAFILNLPDQPVGREDATDAWQGSPHCRGERR